MVTKRPRASRNTSRGISMLEFALTLPLLLFTTLATVDITAVLQARSGMQQAATTALRCVYPVDGVCTAVRGDERERFYEFFSLPDSDDGFIFSREDFSGRATFFRAPRRELGDFRAPRLGSAFFDFDQASYRVSGTIPRMMVEYRELEVLGTVPQIYGSDPRNPGFRFSGNGLGNFPQSPSSSNPLNQRVQIAAQVSGSGTSLSLGASQNETNWRTAFTIELPRPQPRSLCVEEDCDQLTGNAANVVFHLKGTGSSSADNGCGSVELRISSGSGSTNGLGGQELRLNSQSMSRNFYPRGVSPSPHDVDPSLGGHGEWAHGRLELSYDQQHRVEVRLLRDQDAGCNAQSTIGWAATDLDVYTPVFNHKENRETACTQVLSNNGTTECVPERRAVRPEYFVGEPRVSPESTLSIDQVIPSAYSSSHALFLALQEHLGSGVVGPNQVASFGANLATEFVSPVAPRTFSHACPQNTGVDELPDFVPGRTPAYAIQNSSRATQVCPATPANVASAAAAIPFQPILSNVRWSETGPTAVSHPAVTWVKSDCTVQAPVFDALPAALREYPRGKLTWSDVAANPSFEIVTTGRESVGNPSEDPNDPEFLKRTDPRYSCNDLAIGSFSYDDANQRVGRDSLFVGIHDNLDACDRGALLREAAESTNNIPAGIRLLPDMFFTPGRPRPVRRIESDDEPLNSCTAYQIREGQTQGLGDRVPGGPFLEGVLPLACQGQARCRRLFSHFGDGEAGTTEILADRAEALGREELYAAVPWLARTCDSTRCGEIEVVPDSPAPGTITAIARAKVPLTSLLGGSITLEHKHRERLETEILVGGHS